MIKINIKLIDGSVITTETTPGASIEIDGDIGEALREIRNKNLPLTFNSSNAEPFTIEGKDLKSIEFVLDE